MDLIITILPVVTKDLPISPRFTPYNFLSRCKFSTLTTRQPMVEFYLLTFPRFPLRKKEHKSYFGKNRTHDLRTSKCAGYLLDHSRDERLKIYCSYVRRSFCSYTSTVCVHLISRRRPRGSPNSSSFCAKCPPARACNFCGENWRVAVGLMLHGCRVLFEDDPKGVNDDVSQIGAVV